LKSNQINSTLKNAQIRPQHAFFHSQETIVILTYDYEVNRYSSVDPMDMHTYPKRLHWGNKIPG